MRIVVDIRSLAGGLHGGVSEYTLNLLPELFRAGSSHEFILFYNGRKAFSLPRGFLNFKNVHLVCTRYSNKLFTFSCRYLNRPQLDCLAGGADVLFCPHFLPAPVSTACKKVVTFYDLSFEYFPEFFDRRRRMWHRYISPRAQARSSDIIIVPSRVTQNDLAETYGIAQEQIKVIPWGIPDEFFEMGEKNWPQIQQKYQLPERYILSLSTIEPRKNHLALIYAFNHLKNNSIFLETKLVLAGPKGWAYKDVFEEVKKSPYRDDIILTGAIAREDRPDIYRHAGLFVFPSFYEGFGFPPLEAMALGVPTLVSIFSSLPETAGGGAVFVDPYRPAELARVMAEVLTDNELHEKLSREGKEQAAKFRWPKTARAILQVLENKHSTKAQ